MTCSSRLTYINVMIHEQFQLLLPSFSQNMYISRLQIKYIDYI